MGLTAFRADGPGGLAIRGLHRSPTCAPADLVGPGARFRVLACAGDHTGRVGGIGYWRPEPLVDHRDGLTGVLDRPAFMRRHEAEFIRAASRGSAFCLALLDVDDFHALNMRRGYDAGDGVLRRLADHLTAFSVTQESVGRVGADRFGWILHGISSADAVRLLEAVRSEHALAEPAPCPPEVSAGVAFSAGCDGPTQLLRRAEAALREAKRVGGGTVVDAAWVADHPASTDAPRHPFLPALLALARSIDARDPATARHARRVALLADRLAHDLGWSPERRARLRLAAELHDIGKTTVPLEVLLAPGRLTARQRRLMMRHPAAGADMVSSVVDPEQVSWIRHHHERWDGAGYPDGLAGMQIPDGARVLAVADAMDAMTQGRRYQTGRSTGAAVHECRACSGTQFDPRVVATLVRARVSESGAGSGGTGAGAVAGAR